MQIDLVHSFEYVTPQAVKLIAEIYIGQGEVFYNLASLISSINRKDPALDP